ncbi:quinolinate synthase NadA [Salinimicrobium catena]|uniref:quinolinate synthase NadA n=1 Tax=Salinimicrobium catena TaxID=390640 RepID=UPI002FE4F200
MELTTDRKLNLQEQVKNLKKEKNAVILAHYYQEPEIQEIADFIGDSLELARKAAETEADIIVFAGVHFMAETAKILNPSKRVLLPDLKAGCSLADSCPPEAFRKLKEQYPDHVVVTYINCSAEIKTLSEIVCTSSNAEKIINSIPKDKEIIFAPDKNLGSYLMKKTGRKMLLWDGACLVHEAFSLDKLLELYKEHPSAMIIAHPESEEHILKVANYIGSTSGMLNYVRNSEHDKFIVATEAGILHQMQKDVPNKTLIPAPAKEDNTCACSECAFMKMNTLQKLYNCLKNEDPEILLEEAQMEKAHLPIKRMLELS